MLDFATFQLCMAILGTSESTLFRLTTLANASGILVGFLWAFFLQKLWAFQSEGHALPQMLATAVLLVFNIVITSHAIPFLADSLGISVSWAKIFMQIVVVMWNYAILKNLVFKGSREQS